MVFSPPPPPKVPEKPKPEQAVDRPLVKNVDAIIRALIGDDKVNGYAAWDAVVDTAINKHGYGHAAIEEAIEILCSAGQVYEPTLWKLKVVS